MQWRAAKGRQGGPTRARGGGWGGDGVSVCEQRKGGWWDGGQSGNGGQLSFQVEQQVRSSITASGHSGCGATGSPQRPRLRGMAEPCCSVSARSTSSVQGDQHEAHAGATARYSVAFGRWLKYSGLDTGPVYCSTGPTGRSSTASEEARAAWAGMGRAGSGACRRQGSAPAAEQSARPQNAGCRPAPQSAPQAQRRRPIPLRLQ